MEIIKSEADVETHIKEQKILNKEICLIPTMGSLHDGHLELIKKAPTESFKICLLYTSDAADYAECVVRGGRRRR